MTRRKKGGASYFYFFLILYFIYTPISRRILSCLVKLTLLLSNPAEGIAFQNPICQGQSMALQGNALASALRSVATLSNHTSGGFKSAHQCYEWRRYIKMINTSRDNHCPVPWRNWNANVSRGFICHIRKRKITKDIWSFLSRGELGKLSRRGKLSHPCF